MTCLARGCSSKIGMAANAMYHQWQKYLLPRIFSDLHNLGTKRDTTNEHKMNSIDFCSIDLTESFFVVSLSVFKLERFKII